ncbi:OapA N-terminal domain-containing protein [Sphingomonas aerophila]
MAQFRAWFDQLPKLHRILITVAVWAAMFAAGIEIGRTLFQASH